METNKKNNRISTFNISGRNLFRKRKTLIILFFISFIIIGISVGFYLNNNYQTYKATEYISEKYNFDDSEIELLDYKPSSFWITDNPIPWLKKAPSSWLYRCNGNDFFVKKYGKRFCDDYQLADVRMLSKEYFSENISSNIIDFKVESNDLFQYQLSLYDKGYEISDTVISQDNIVDYICRENALGETKWIYVKSLGNLMAEEKERERIKKIISKKLPSTCADDYGVLFE